MPATPEDRALARSLARRVIESGAGANPGSVRRVILFGSRARGTAQPESDVDLLVLVEPPACARWRPADNLAARDRLRRAIGGASPVPLDLWVRSTDQYAEAHGVIGGVEHSAMVQGVALHDEPLGRAPVRRRSPDAVRLDNARDWLLGARQQLAGAVAASRRGDGASAAFLAHRATHWSCAALCALGQRPLPDKRRTTNELLDRMAELALPAGGATLCSVRATSAHPVATAYAALGVTADCLADDHGGSHGPDPALAALRRSLERPLVLLDRPLRPGE